MTTRIASLGFVVLVLGLFWLDRDRTIRTSKALWLPILWCSLAGSRSVSQWLQVGTQVSSSAQLLEGNPLDRLIYTAMLFVGLAVLAGRRRTGRLLEANLPILLFFLFCLMSIIWSDFPEVAFKRWTKAIGDLVMILIVLTETNPLGALDRFFSRMAYVLIPLSVLFIKYYPQLGVAYGPWGGVGAYVGVAMSKNTLGALCLCLGIGTVWRFLVAYHSREKRRSSRILARGTVLLIVLWLLVITNCLTALAAFVMAGSLLLVANIRTVTRHPVILHLLVVVMLTVSVSVLFLGTSPDTLKDMGRDPTLTDRTQIWGVLLGLVQNPLLGAGFESFWLGPRLDAVWAKFWFHPQQAHNGYLEIYLNLGWMGILLLGGVLVAGYRTVCRAWRNDVLTGAFKVALFFVGITFNFTEAAFFRMQATTWLFFLFAIVAVPRLPNPVKIDSRQKKPLGQPEAAEADIWYGGRTTVQKEQTV